MFLPGISNALEEGTVRLRSLRQALVYQGLLAETEQRTFVVDLGIAVTFHTFDLAQVLGMRWVRTSEHFLFAIEARDFFVKDSISGKSWTGL